MTSPSRQGRDPQPLGRAGEVALVVLAGLLLAIGLAALVGLGTASWAVGGGWVWPRGSNTIGAVLGGLLTGHPGAGLTPELAARVPEPLAVYVGVAVAELLLAVVGTTAGVLGWRYRRPGDARRGMATRAEAAAVLGTGRLREARRILRPDLYPSRRSRR